MFVCLSGQALSKKENKGGGAGSPDGGDSDGELETLTPRTEAKYNKIDEEFQIMMQHRNHVNGNAARNLQAGFATMPVSVPVGEARFGDNASQNPGGGPGGMPISPGHLSVHATSPRPASNG